MSQSDVGYVYMIVVREFLKNQESVVKCGCTHDIISRVGQYPRGSKAEKRMLHTMKENFVHWKDIGREYFEGSIAHMTGFIQMEMQSPLNIFNKHILCEAPTNKLYRNNISLADMDKLNYIDGMEMICKNMELTYKEKKYIFERFHAKIRDPFCVITFYDPPKDLDFIGTHECIRGNDAMKDAMENVFFTNKDGKKTS
jgi:hypothetical protein